MPIPDPDFDKNFNRTKKLAGAALVASTTIGLLLLGVFVWVAWHFVSKVW